LELGNQRAREEHCCSPCQIRVISSAVRSTRQHSIKLSLPSLTDPQKPSPTRFNQTLTSVLTLCADPAGFSINRSAHWSIAPSWYLGTGSAFGLQSRACACRRSTRSRALRLWWPQDEQLCRTLPSTLLLCSSDGVCKVTRPSWSSVAVRQQKSLSTNLHVVLPGSCQKSCEAAHLFSWCFACWTHWVCAWV